VSIVHTLKNCIVSLSQTDVLQKTQDDMYKDSREKLTIKRRSRTSMQRFLQLVDGGHSLIEVFELIIILGKFKCSMVIIYGFYES